MPSEQVGAAYAKIGLDSSGFESALKSAESAFTSAAGSIESAALRIGSSVKTGLEVAAASLAALSVAGIKSVADFQEEMYNLERASGLAGTALKQVTDANRDLSTQLGQSRESLDAVSTSLAAIAKTPEGLNALTKNVAELSQVSGATNTAVADLDKQISKVWNEGTSGIMKLNDGAIALKDSMNADEQATLEFLAAFGPIGQAVGVTDTQAEALGATFQKAGLDGSTAVTEIYTSTTGLIKNIDKLDAASKEMTKGTKEIGPAYTDAAKTAQQQLNDIQKVFGVNGQQMKADFERDYAGSLVKYGALLSKNKGDLEAFGTVQDITGARGAKLWMQLGDQTDNYNKSLQVLEDNTQIAADKQKDLGEKAGEIWTKVKNIFNSLKDAVLSFGEAIEPALSPVLDKVLKFAQDLDRAFRNHDWNAVGKIIADGINEGIRLVIQTATTIGQWIESKVLAWAGGAQELGNKIGGWFGIGLQQAIDTIWKIGEWVNTAVMAWGTSGGEDLGKKIGTWIGDGILAILGIGGADGHNWNDIGISIVKGIIEGMQTTLRPQLLEINKEIGDDLYDLATFIQGSFATAWNTIGRGFTFMANQIVNDIPGLKSALQGLGIGEGSTGSSSSSSSGQSDTDRLNAARKAYYKQYPNGVFDPTQIKTQDLGGGVSGAAYYWNENTQQFEDANGNVQPDPNASKPNQYKWNENTQRNEDYQGNPQPDQNANNPNASSGLVTELHEIDTALKGDAKDLFKWNDVQSDGMGKQKAIWDVWETGQIALAYKAKDDAATNSQKVTEAATTFKNDVTSSAKSFSDQIDTSKDFLNKIDWSKPATALTQAATTAGQVTQKYSEVAGTALSLGAQVGANFTRDGGNAVKIGLTASGKEIAVIGSVAQQQFSAAGGQWVASTTAAGEAMRTGLTAGGAAVQMGLTASGQKIAVIGSVAQQQFAAAGNQFKSDGVTVGSQFRSDGVTVGSQFRSDGAATGSQFKSDGAVAGNELIAGAQQAGKTFSDFYSSMAGSDFAKSLSSAKGIGNSGSVPSSSNNPPNDSGWLNGGYNAEGGMAGETSANAGLPTSPALKGNAWDAVYDNSGTCVAYVEPDKSLKFTPSAQQSAVLDNNAWNSVYDNSGTCVAFNEPDPSLKFTPAALISPVLDKNAWNAVYDNSGTCVAFVEPDPSLKFTPGSSGGGTSSANQLDIGMTKAVGTLTQGATQAAQTGISGKRQESQIGLQGAQQQNQVSAIGNNAIITARQNIENQIANRSLTVAQQTANIAIGSGVASANIGINASNVASNIGINASNVASNRWMGQVNSSASLWNGGVSGSSNVWGAGVTVSREGWGTGVSGSIVKWGDGVDSTGKVIVGSGTTFASAVVNASATMLSSVTQGAAALSGAANALGSFGGHYGSAYGNDWYKGGASGLNQYLNGPNAPQWPTWMTDANPTMCPGSAEGGIFSTSTVRRIGEAGREAIVPLDDKAAGMRILAAILPEFSNQSQGAGSSGGGMSGGMMQTIIVELNGRQIASAVMPFVVGSIRLKTGGNK